jgi:DNA-binding FadR family transcriptional regulator
LHAQVVDLLGRRIVSGYFAPGTTLDLARLEQEMGVSHTVVRESLKVLTSKGLVGAKQKRGTFVAETDSWNALDDDVLRWRASSSDGADQFEQLAELRRIIEPAAAALAAQRADEADIEALTSMLAQMHAAHTERDGTREAEADVAFHESLLRATHNELLVGLRSAIKHGLYQRDLLVHAHGDLRLDPLPNHQAVLDAVVARDPDQAAQAMLSLLDAAAADFDEVRAAPRPATNRPRKGTR